MGTVPLGIVMNGVTGRMGYRQHLCRSILAIREQGGVLLPDGTRVLPEPILVGRDEAKLADIAARHGLTRWTTDLERPSPSRTPPSTSTPRSRASGRRRSPPRSPPASTSTPRSRSRRASRARSSWRGRRATPG